MKKTSKILAAVMAIVMIVAAIPMTAFAADYTIALGETITVTIPAKGYAEYKFTPEEDGKYVVYSDMGESDIDPYVIVYDADGNEITRDYGNEYADTYDFYCIFEAEAGADYLFKLISYKNYAIEYDVTVSVFGEITHQPTADEPYVEVTEGADAEYQWYKVGNSFTELTDEHAEAREGVFKGDYATYDSENGWTGAVNGYLEGYEEYNFFKVMLPEDQTIKMTADTDAVKHGILCLCRETYETWEDVDANDTVEFTADHTCIYYTWGYYEQEPHLKAEMSEMKKVNTDAELKRIEAGTYVCIVTFDGSRFEVSDEVEISESDIIPEIELNETITVTIPAKGYAEYRFTPDEDGKYVVYSDMGESDLDPNVKVYDKDGNFIASGDDNFYARTNDFYCIFRAKAGADYLFKMTSKRTHAIEYDITVSVFGKITHQPTADEPYVEVTEGADAEYQWYKLGDSFAELTDEYAEAREGDVAGEFATYDSENGWTGVIIDTYGSGDEYNFFKVMLPEDQTIKMTADTDAVELGIWCICGDCNEVWDDVNANDTVEFTADHTCVYNTWGYYEHEPHLKAEMPEIKKVNTDAELKAEGVGTYVCLVTFDGCRIEASDEVEITECKHSYADGNDAVCDYCEFNRAENCDCKCHQGGIAGFFFKIVLFFQKLFGQNKVCACGMNH